jgi:hypothetical protein
MTVIKIKNHTGDFAEDKDVARELRLTQIMPSLQKGEEITLDFSAVELTTQSFIHALISEAIRIYGIDVVDLLLFKGCNRTVRTIINVVVDYMQDTIILKDNDDE